MKSRLWIALHALVALVPLAGAALHAPDVTLFGAEVRQERPAFSLEDWRSEKLQPAFQRWFETNIGFRGVMVRSDSSFQAYVLGAAKPGGVIVLGRDQTLFVKEDLALMGMRAQDLPEVALRTEILAERLGRLQRTLASRGKKLVVILSPSKSVIYPDEVPTDWRRAPEYRSDLEIHDLFTSAMQRHGVLLADGHALLAGKTGADRDLVYTRTGRHWTELGACLVLRDAFLGGPVTPTCAYELTLPDRTRSGDYDLYRLLNLWRSNEVPAPVPQVTEIAREGLAPRPRTLFIGTSFMWILAKIMRPLIEAPIAFYYNITVFDVAGQPRPIEPVDPASPRWTGYALDRDLYVLEILETYAYGDEPIKFADSMLERLR